MIRKIQWSLVAVLLAMLGHCNSSLAQQYSAPSASVRPYRNSRPTIANRVSSLQQAIRNSGYSGGGNAPSNSPAFSSTIGGARLSLGANTSSGGSKPFSSYQAAPTVSPYLNLFRTDLNGGGNFNYSTLVQPQLQQQQVNQQQQRQNYQTNRRLQSIAAQADFNQQGSKDVAPTGHQTVFQYTGRYYSLPMTRQKKR